MSGPVRFELSRRALLRGGSAALGTSALSGLSFLLASQTSRAEPVAPVQGAPVLLCVFLRGAADGLNLVVPHGDAANVEVASLLAEAERGSLSHAPEDADELRLVASFLRRPPPELRVGPLEAPTLCALVRGLPLAA